MDITKKCPQCGARLGFFTTTVLGLSRGAEPEECHSCGLYLSNYWVSELAFVALFAFAIFVLIREGWIVYLAGFFEMLLFIGVLFVTRYLLCIPRPYVGRKGWCPRCHREDAFHDWTNDPTCVECEYRLRPGFRIVKRDDEQNS